MGLWLLPQSAPRACRVFLRWLYAGHKVLKAGSLSPSFSSFTASHPHVRTLLSAASSSCVLLRLTWRESSGSEACSLLPRVRVSDWHLYRVNLSNYCLQLTTEEDSGKGNSRRRRAWLIFAAPFWVEQAANIYCCGHYVESPVIESGTFGATSAYFFVDK